MGSADAGDARLMAAAETQSAGPAATGLPERVGGLADRPVAQRVRLLLERRHGVLALALYILGALYIQHHAVAHMGTQISGSIIGDPSQYMWAMWWWPHAIFAGVNPFVTHAIWVPNAYNLGSVTSTPLPSILFAPLNAVLGWSTGPVVSYNICNLLAPVLSAWFAYRLCLYLTRRPAASIVGGWLYGFSVYGLSQLQGHLNLVFTFLPVVLALLTIQRLDAVISRRRYVLLSAVALIAQIGIGTEIVFTTTCLAVAGCLAGLVLAPASVRGRLFRVVVIELIGAYVVAGIVCSPLLYYALKGPPVNPGYNSRLNVADLLSYVIPTPIVRIGQQRFAGLASQFPPAAGFEETGTYLGLPLLAVAITSAVQGWRRWGVKVAIIVAFIAFIWSLGPTLTVAGQGTIWLPWSLLDLRRDFEQISPVRVGVYVELAAAIAMALWLARSSRWWPGKWLLALVAVAVVFPNVNGNLPGGFTKIYDENVSTPAFFTTHLYRRYLEENEVVLPIPFGPFGNSMLWQAQDRGYFREASGWFGYYPPDYADNTAVSELLGFHTFTDPTRLLQQFFVSRDVGAVVIVAGQGGPWPQVLAQLGLHEVSVGGVDLYRIPASLRTR